MSRRWGCPSVLPQPLGVLRKGDRGLVDRQAAQRHTCEPSPHSASLPPSSPGLSLSHGGILTRQLLHGQRVQPCSVRAAAGVAAAGAAATAPPPSRLRRQLARRQPVRPPGEVARVVGQCLSWVWKVEQAAPQLQRRPPPPPRSDALVLFPPPRSARPASMPRSPATSTTRPSRL